MTADTHAAEARAIRDELEVGPEEELELWPSRVAALAALDRLLAALSREQQRADDAERLNERLREERDNWHASAVSDRQRREIAEAEASRLGHWWKSEAERREQLEAALRAYHACAPAAGQALNECGYALIYSDFHRANQLAAAALAAADPAPPRCPECGDELQLGHDCLAAPDAGGEMP